MKKKLEETPVVFCCGDLCDGNFLVRIRRVLEKRGWKISFANLTNVHEHTRKGQTAAKTPAGKVAGAKQCRTQ